MFKNIKIISKIVIGFGVLFGLLLGISGLAFFSIDHSGKSFNQYRELARDSVLAGRLQANMLLVRFYTNRFLKTGSENDVEECYKRGKLMQQFINEAESEIRKPERAERVDLIRDLVDDYVKSFDKIIAYKKKRDTIIYESLDPNGLSMRKAMTDIVESAYDDGDLTAAYFAGRIQEHLLLGRLYATKFLDTNKMTDVERFNYELVENIGQIIETMKTELQDPERIALFDEFLEKRNIYQDNFKNLVEIIRNRNRIIKGELDRIGPIIANAAENIKLSVKRDQDILGPDVKRNNEQSILRIIYVCIASLISAIILGVVIIRAIKKPIGMLVDTVTEFGKGNLDIRIDIQSDDEIGLLSNAFNTMAGQVNVTTKKQVELNWLASTRVDFDDNIRGIQEIEKLSYKVLDYMASILDVQVGAFYVVDNDNQFKFVSGYACKKEEVEDKVFALGEGLIGQAAKKGDIIFLKDVPDDYVSPSITSGIGKTRPKYIIALPVIFMDRPLCVIELAKLDTFSELQIEFMNQVKTGFGIALNAVFANVKLKELLEKSENQGNQLMAQQEELKLSNEELQESEQKLKSQQEELQTANEQLESQSEELQTANEELEDKALNLQLQQKEIEKKNIEIEVKASDIEMTSRYKSEFLANMSHELRTPLNSILLLARYLFENKQQNLKEKEVEMAQNIHSSGNSLLSLIDDILDLAKIESGKTELNLENTALNRLAELVEWKFGHSVKEKGLVLNVRVDKGLPVHVYTDQQRLEQIINNFISNSLKFTSSGSISFNITRLERGANLTACGLKTEKAIAFSVSDTGEGIPQDRHGMIFEAFKQADGSTSRQYGGTGLGLSICKNLAHLMGGEIQLRSEIGKGSTFTLYLPEVLETDGGHDIVTASTAKEQSGDPQPYVLHKKHVVKEAPAPVQVIPDDRADLSPGGRTLLIIEDDMPFAKILLDLGNERGYKCLVAGDGESGLQLARKYSPDAIILDIVLPKMNGWIVMDNLKNDPATRHIPVHICSVEDKKKTAMKIGAIGFFSKPVSVEQLDDAFKQIELYISKDIMRLLIVEKDRTVSKSIAELLGNGDIEIFNASTGKEAMELLKSEHFDCMVLDLGVSDISGFVILDFIKKDKSLSNIPVIIYSGKRLSVQDEKELEKYTDSIVLKKVKSPERLLDEVSLFLHRVEADLPKDKQEMIRMVHDKELVLRNKKVLLVDDDMRNVFALKSFLDEKGMNVLVGANGEEGLECLDQDPDVDIVLMDIMMPKMDGYEAIRRIRKQKRFKQLPIIALTAKAMQADRVKCIEAGADDYMAKPIDIDRLTSLLHVWLY